MGVRAKFEELDKHIENLKGLDDKAREELNDNIAGVLESSTVQRFEEEHDPAGKKWKPNLRGGRILTLHGYLCGSIIGQATKDYAEVGSAMVYAAIHQYGGTIKAKVKNFLKFNMGGRWASKKAVTITARPYLGLSKRDEDDICRGVENFLNGALS